MSIKKSRARGPRLAARASGNGVWDIGPWCEQFGIGQSTYFTLKEKPLSVLIPGKRLRKIIESPEAYTRRVAGLQQSAEPRAA